MSDPRQFLSRHRVGLLVPALRPVAVAVVDDRIAVAAPPGPVRLVVTAPLELPDGTVLFEQLVVEGTAGDGGLPLADARMTVALGAELPAARRAGLLLELWARGAAGDDGSIERLRAAWPDDVDPAFLRGPHDTRLHCALLPGEEADAAALAATVDWNEGLPLDAVAALTRGSTVWVGVRDAQGALIGTARAISDGGKYAWVYDVVVGAAWRGKGIGDAMFALLLDHPAMRGCAVVLLQTRDAAPFYARFGFTERPTWPKKPWISTDMALWRRLLPHMVAQLRAM